MAVDESLKVTVGHHKMADINTQTMTSCISKSSAHILASGQ